MPGRRRRPSARGGALGRGDLAPSARQGADGNQGAEQTGCSHARAGALAREAGAQRAPAKAEVAHHIQHLVPHELVRPAQPAGVEDHRPVHHHRIGQAAALGEAGRAQPRHFLGEGEGAGIGQPLAEGMRRDAHGQGLAADGGAGEVDLQLGVEGGLAGGQQLGEGAGPVLDPHRVQHPMHAAARQDSWRRCRRSRIRKTRARRNRHDRDLRRVNLDHASSMPAAGQRRHDMLDGARPRLRPLADGGAQTRIDHAVIGRGDVDAEIGAAEHDAGARGGRAQGEGDATVRMQADADAPDGCLQRPAPSRVDRKKTVHHHHAFPAPCCRGTEAP